MVQLEIQGSNGRVVMREDVVNCQVSDTDSSERLLHEIATLTRSVGSVLALSEIHGAGVVGGGESKGGWGGEEARAEEVHI